MKKRIIALLCVFALMAGMLAGCKEIDLPYTRKEDNSPKGSSGGNSYTVYAKCFSGWGAPYLWAWSESEGDLYEEWPGKAMKIGSDGWYSLRVPVEYDNVIVFGQDGEIQTEEEYTGGQDIWFTIDEDGYYVDGSKPAESAAPAPAPAEPEPKDNYIAELKGSWEKVNLKDGNSNLNVSAQVYSQTVYNCTEMTIHMEVEMNAGTSCKDWQVWGRSGGSFVKIGTIYLAAGNGYTYQTLTFSKPVTFDAIAITPTIPGGYSWSMGFELRDIYYK